MSAGRGLGIFGLVLHNVTNRPLRLAFASLAIAIGVMTAVTFNIVSSSIDQNTLDRIRRTPGVATATGVLIGTTRLNAATRSSSRSASSRKTWPSSA